VATRYKWWVSNDLAELARAAVVEALGSRTWVRRVEALATAETSAVLLVTVDHPFRQLVFKALHLGATTPTDFARTAAVTERARSVGVPVAAVLAVDTSYRAGPWQYLLQEHVPGREWRHVRPLLGDDQVQTAHRQIAEVVLAIQSVRFDGFGELDRQARSAGGTLLDGLRRRAELRIPRPDHREAFFDLLDREQDLFAEPGPATLSHDDLHHGNVVFAAERDGWRLAGILDWDKAWAGPAESDVARLAFWDDMTGPAFWATYRAATPATPGEPRRALVHQLLWCLEYDLGSARHAADTAALGHRLDVRLG
jgi:aminoglycoside phosphotransferase (APT) family kinase protein